MSRRNPFPGGFWKKITIRAIFPGVRRIEKTFAPTPGMAWNAAGEQSILEQQANLLETRYPEWEWRMVELPNHTFNFIAKKKEGAAA